MIFHDSLYNCQTEAGAFFPGRHIRFRQTITIRLRKPPARIVNINDNPLILPGD